MDYLLQYGSHSTGALAFFGVIIAALLAYFGGRGSATAQLQTALNGAFQTLMTDLQLERTALIARVAELEHHAQSNSSEINGLKQYNASLEHLLLTQGIALPERPHIRGVEVIEGPKHVIQFRPTE